MSNIEWTEKTWNPVTGCSKVSAGCKNCYAERMTKRLQAMGQKKYVNGFDVVTMHEETLREPFRWRKPKMVFVNSMSDLFHWDVSVDFIKATFLIMATLRRHTFQVLTKREERLFYMDEKIDWPENVWMGVSVETGCRISRINRLRRCGARTKFISFEPLLADVGRIELTGIDWVIVGGESGPGARPMKKEWVRSIRDQCEDAGIPFFFKQWGGVNKKKAGRMLDGRTWDEYPGVRP